MQDYHCFCEFLMDFHSKNWCCAVAHDACEPIPNQTLQTTRHVRRNTHDLSKESVCVWGGVWCGAIAAAA